ncbi:hypothetical protein FJ656_07510, partial [Schumannella luteola]
PRPTEPDEHPGVAEAERAGGDRDGDRLERAARCDEGGEERAQDRGGHEGQHPRGDRERDGAAPGPDPAPRDPQGSVPRPAEFDEGPGDRAERHRDGDRRPRGRPERGGDRGQRDEGDDGPEERDEGEADHPTRRAHP